LEGKEGKRNEQEREKGILSFSYQDVEGERNVGGMKKEGEEVLNILSRL
jgi:hypothetical protein